MDWNDVRYFLALARAGSVRGAGSTLGVSHSTVARRVEALEKQLNVRLFDRHRDGYLLTSAGKQMVAGAERVEQEMSTLERSAAGQDARLEGPVRVTCTDNYVGRILMRSLAELCARHPGIEIELDSDPRFLDLSKREADVAVRAVALGAMPQDHLLGRKVAPIVLANYVADEHAERLDPNKGQARWLGSDRKVVESLIASSSYPALPIWGRFTSISIMAEAAHLGLGLVMLPTYVGDPDPLLRRLDPPDVRHLADFWLLSHPDLRDNARLQAARECVASAFQRQVSLFRGDSLLNGDSLSNGDSRLNGAALQGWSEDAPVRPADGPFPKRSTGADS